MAHINLLPWRAERRAALQKRFLTTLGVVAVGTAAVMFGVYYHYDNAVAYQRERNAFLEAEIKALDAQIEEIKELEDIKSAVLNRIQIIERLQQQRPQIVHLFDEWVDTLPEGVYLQSIEQVGENNTRIKGNAQSNARVSSYMRNLDNSEWLDDPRLVIIRTKDAENGTRNSEFTLLVDETNPLLPTEDEAADDGTEGAAL